MEVIIGMKNKFNGSEPEGKVTVKAIGEFKILRSRKRHKVISSIGCNFGCLGS